VSAISHIINYDIPMDSQNYVHRIGRTARMGAKGTAITFVTSEQGKELTAVEKLINRQIPLRAVPEFVTSQGRPQPMDRPRHAPVSRYQAPVLSTVGEAPAPSRPKTLGSRFRTKRGRRRL
ncbi:MAG: helicase-related protein, partial [Planctomycetota bacterium]